MIETVYLGHDNSIDLLLKSDGTAYDLSSVTKMTITIGGVTVESTNQAGDPILWNQGSYDTGEARFFLGDQSIEEGTYRKCYVVVYDANNGDGIVWGSVYLKVIAEVEES